MTDQEAKDLTFDGWPMADGYLIELGRITALWSVLESLLGLFIGKLAGFNDDADPPAFTLVTHSSFPQRLDMLGASVSSSQSTIQGLRRLPTPWLDCAPHSTLATTSSTTDSASMKRRVGSRWRRVQREAG